MLIYKQTSTVQINLSRVGCTFVSIYMCTMRLKELTVAWQKSKPISCKMHAFSKMQLLSHCCTAGLYEPISKLYIYKNSAVYVSDARVTGVFFVCFVCLFFFFVFFFFVFFLFFFFVFFFFCKVQELRNPTIKVAT